MPIASRSLLPKARHLCLSLGVIAVSVTLASVGAAQRQLSTGDDPANSLQVGLWVDAVRNLAIAESTQINNIALPGYRDVNLRLERFSIIDPDAIIVAVSEAGERPLDVSGVVLLRGSVVGDDESKVFVSLSDFGLQGFIETAGSVYSMSSGLGIDGFGGPDDLRITRVDAAAQALNAPPITCGVTPDNPELHPGGVPEIVNTLDLQATLDRGDPPCRVARIAIDTDWEFTSLTFGGDPNAAAAYAITLLGGVSEIFQDNVNVRFALSYLRVWEFNIDPYNEGGDLLQEFRSHWNANMGWVQRDIAHLLSGRSDLPYGGVAYLNALCSSNFGYGLSGYLNGSFPYPLINNNSGNWDLVVMAHELGHNFGTGHTHSAYSPPIDNCGNGDCTGASNGTIMSYCHTCSGGISNITLNFHPLVRSQILSYLAGACDLTASGANAIDDTASTLGGEPVVIDVLLNDIAASCDSVELLSFDQQSLFGGQLELVPGSASGLGRDQIQYTPPAGHSGTDSFLYTVTGGKQATVFVDVLALRQPDSVGATEPGVFVDYYVLQSPSVLPDFDLLTPYASDGFDLINFPSTNGEFATSGRADDVGAVFTGYAQVPTAGMYTFYTKSDDGSRLYIGDSMVVDNDGLHGMQERSGLIALAPGKHEVRVEFFERAGGAGLIVRFEGPGISKRVIEAERWFRPIDCPGDVTGSGTVDLDDLNAVLTNFGTSGPAGDANGDGVVDLDDLNLVLTSFGTSCL